MGSRKLGLLSLFLILANLIATSARCVEVSDQFVKDFEEMKKQIQMLQKERPVPIADSKVQKTLDNKYASDKYGPNQSVFTKTGKLRIGGLTQIWYYTPVQHDNRGLFDDVNNSGVHDQLSTLNNDSFRIRRTELHFNMDMTENVTAYVIVDPAREATAFPNLPVQSTSGNFKRTNNVAPEWIAANKANGLNSTGQIGNIQSGAGTTNRALQDAWIDYHDALPHHDFLVGQVHPWFGEEGIRTSRELDFCERSQIGFIGDSRDLGVSVHGAWWDVDDKTPAWSSNPSGRIQYWISAMDGAGTFHSAGGYQNRPDDNEQKDFGYRILVRPVWKQEKWGSLELGMSSQFGQHGDSKSIDPITEPNLDLNRKSVFAYRHDAWGYYAPGSVLRGMWIRGEWAEYHDRLAPGGAIDLAGGGDNPKALFAQDNPRPFTSHGWYVAAGYKMADSRWNTCGMPGWLKPFEFTARFDTFQNVQVADPLNNGNTRLYATDVFTGGINYYIKGHNAKIQMNYNKVNSPQSGVAQYTFHQVDQDNFIMNFQVGF